MRYAASFIILIHGCIHLMGFAKAFGYGGVQALTKNIPKWLGSLWLLAAVLFITAAVLVLIKKETWWMVVAAAVVISQVLIFTAWNDAKFGTLINLLLLFTALVGFGTRQFKSRYNKDVTSYLKYSGQFLPALLTEADMQDLPDPVKRYLRYTHAVGQPKVKYFKLNFTGKIRKQGGSWMPFTSEQYNFTEPSTRLFFMNATMKLLPVAGYHCYKNGKAFMDIRLLSLFKVQYQQGNEMDSAETVTFFNDMCCMAPATLIDKRITWLETDGNTVKAQFTANGITIAASLYFNDEGQLVNFISDDRYAQQADGTLKKTRWSTPLKEYREINGYRLASYAQTVYAYPGGDFCYGIFELDHIACNVP